MLRHLWAVDFSDSTLVQHLLTSSMAAESFDPHTCTCVQALVELEPGIACARCTRRYPSEPSQLGFLESKLTV